MSAQATFFVSLTRPGTDYRGHFTPSSPGDVTGVLFTLKPKLQTSIRNYGKRYYLP